MKAFQIIPIILLIILVSCGEEETPVVVEAEEKIEELLHYDGENHSAPLFAAGSNAVATLFPLSVVRQHQGKHLSEIRFYIAELPQNLILTVHKGSWLQATNEIVYEQNLTDQLQAEQWMAHQLSNPITLGEQDLWIVLTFTDFESGHFMGCDSGPQRPSGALHLADMSDQWETFFLDVNWNIRGVLTDGGN